MERQRYYPTYKYKERDVVLVEFEEAQKIANGQSNLYGQLANLLIAFATIGITLLLKTANDSANDTVSLIKNNVLLLNFFLFVIAYVILRYFIELQRTIVVNSRKVVTLRTMLGLDYGQLQLTLPNWRVEGATNPFVIKLFPGWFKFGSSPFWIIVLTLNVVWFFSYQSLETKYLNSYWYLVNISLTAFYALIFRIQLNETHETFYLSFVKFGSRILRIKLIKDFEYVLYRTKLAVHEKQRLRYDTNNVEKILVQIEDSRFFEHKGIDPKSFGRSILSLSKNYRNKNGLLKSGGSTITMQLCRTLFIPTNQNAFRRKLVEILLSIWCEKQFKKNEILNYYLTSVRFESGKNGIISASKHFFSNQKSFTNEEAFFLIERLSNVTSSYRIERIKNLHKRINSSSEVNLNFLLQLYTEQNKAKRIKLMEK